MQKYVSNITQITVTSEWKISKQSQKKKKKEESVPQWKNIDKK